MDMHVHGLFVVVQMRVGKAVRFPAAAHGFFAGYTGFHRLNLPEN